MADEDRLKDIVEQAQDKMIQRIIDVQEGKLGREEQKAASTVPTEKELAHWTHELDKLKQEKPHGGKGRWSVRFILVAALLAVLLALSVGALRTGIFNFFIDAHEQFTQIHTSQSPERVVAEWKQVYLPSTVPAGFSISSPIDDQNIKSIEYSNPAGKRILYYQYSPNSNIRLDTENADEQYISSVNGETAYFLEKGTLSTLYWSMDGYILSIEFEPATVKADEILEMAESVQFIN